MNLKNIVRCLILASVSVCFAQEKGFPVRILFGNEATALPFDTFWSSPTHFTMQLGSEFEYHTKPKHYLYQTVNVGYIYHENLFQGGYLNSELGYDYRLGLGLNLKGLVGVGYLHTFSTEEEYKFDNGQYRSNEDKGNSRVMPSLALGLGFRLNKKQKAPELILLYRTWVEFPYSPGFIPLMSHTDLSLGIKLFIH